jgi:serine/threonine protein kinase
MGRTLGVGGFGKVILGKNRENKKEVAIKFTDVGNELSSANLISAIYKEAESLKALIHKNIVQLFHAFIDGKQFIMIMEAAMGGELLDYLKKNDKMDEKDARFILMQIVHAMLYCHSRGVVHRDLKLENVLFKNQYFEDDFIVKVVDFGIAGMGGDKVDAGTLAYMAPECLEKTAAETNPAIDVWAIGIMLYAMLYGELPFSSSNEKDLIKAIKSDNIKFPNNIPVTEEAKDVIRKMLCKDHTQRLKLIEFIDMPYSLWDEEEFESKLNEVKGKFES